MATVWLVSGGITTTISMSPSATTMRVERSAMIAMLQGNARCCEDSDWFNKGGSGSNFFKVQFLTDKECMQFFQ